jgi:hypothetical protein
MADYSSNLNTDLYKYRQPIRITEPTGEGQTYVPLKLNLDINNFNFDLAQSDGLDFRLAERSNGTGVYTMWVAYWDSSLRKATLWFKIPALLASETKTLYAFWGYEYDTGISDLNNMTTGITKEYSGNLCTSGTITGDGTEFGGEDPENNMYNLFDGSSDTFWWVSPGAGTWVQYDFGAGNEKQIELVRMDQFDAQNISIQGSNDNVYFSTLISRQFPDMPGGSVPALTDWILTAFDNNTAYRYIRVNIISGWGNSWIATQIEMKEVISETVVEDGIFSFADDFDGSSLDVSKWPTSAGSFSISDSKINLGTDAWIRTFTGAISTEIPVNWIVEEGIVGIGSPTTTTVAAHRYRFYGSENNLGIDYYWDGSTDRRHDFVSDGTYATYNGTNKGLQEGSYSQNYIAYYEPTDRVYQSMYNRTSYADYDDSWERKVNRNTEVTNFRIYGEDTSAANGVSVDWVIVRVFIPDKDPTVDYSDLYVQYEYVGHQILDYDPYQSDVTSVDFHHTSDMGGDPYKMSDDVTNSISNIFISDGEATDGNIVLDFGRGRYSITDKNYIHFDSDRVIYYNAAKLSDLDTDVHGRDYWQGTTTSGWVAIQFPSAKDIACLSLRAVPGSINKMVKTFKFYGSQSDPRFIGWNDKVFIYEGVTLSTEEEQTFYFSTGLTSYEYYILEVIDTNGGDVAIQEWGMYEYNSTLGKRVISQLRLHPVAFTDNEYYFSKEIEFYGSNDGFVWDTLISRIDTPTPFTNYAYGRWSRYSFDNLNAYYLYKLSCYGNWRAPDDIIKMAEWEMVERSEEQYNIRVLDGSTNNINNIWADPTSTISSGTVYFTNDKFSTVEFDKLIYYATVSGAVDDFNVKT